MSSKPPAINAFLYRYSELSIFWFAILQKSFHNCRLSLKLLQYIFPIACCHLRNLWLVSYTSSNLCFAQGFSFDETFSKSFFPIPSRIHFFIFHFVFVKLFLKVLFAKGFSKAFKTSCFAFAKGFLKSFYSIIVLKLSSMNFSVSSLVILCLFGTLPVFPLLLLILNPALPRVIFTSSPIIPTSL